MIDLRRQPKSNDLGAFLENEFKMALGKRNCLFWRLHTIRSWKGITNPCDFIVLDNKFTALIECKATLDSKFSCSGFQQVEHFEKSVQFAHTGLYGVVVCFYSERPFYVYASDVKVIENKRMRRPIRTTVKESFDLIDDSLEGLIEQISKLQSETK